jgi:hypothetical protein
MEQQQVKYAGYVGNKHCAVRVTQFFNKASEVAGSFEFTAPCANWKEHQRWNQQRVGNYASCPVAE